MIKKPMTISFQKCDSASKEIKVVKPAQIERHMQTCSNGQQSDG